MEACIGEDRIIAFVDVIGWRSALKCKGHIWLVQVARSISKHKQQFSSVQEDQIRTCFEELEKKSGLMQPKHEEYNDIKFSFVSDSFIISSSVWNVYSLFNVTRWACMTLLCDYGFLTRGGIAKGLVTHDTERDIIVGQPLVDAVHIEKTTSRPRIEISKSVLDFVYGKNDEAEKLIYYDGEKNILNICESGDDWIFACEQQIDTGLRDAPEGKSKNKWCYMKCHLKPMRKKLLQIH